MPGAAFPGAVVKKDGGSQFGPFEVQPTACDAGQISAAATDCCLARSLRAVAVKEAWGQAELDLIRTLALSAAYRLEKLAGIAAGK